MTETPTTHTVVSGDTLWALARAYYGTGMEWKKIFDANQPMLTDPDVLKPGEVLAIP